MNPRRPTLRRLCALSKPGSKAQKDPKDRRDFAIFVSFGAFERPQRLPPTALRLLSFSTSGGRTAITRSMSASVLFSPRLNRIELNVRAWGRPMAFNTCDGSSVPDEHADP